MTHADTPDCRTDDAAKLPKRIIGSLAFGTVLQALNSTMIAVALVSIREDFDAGQLTFWLVSALYLTTAVAAPVMGRIADLVGARKVFLTGLCLVVVSSCVAPYAPGIGTLIACRVVLGIGTAAQYPSAVAMIRQVTEERQARPQTALGALAVCAQVVGALGPTVGGVMVDLLRWPGIFLLNVPMALIAGTAVLLTVPAEPTPPTRATGLRERLTAAQFDVLGMLLFTAVSTALMLFLFSLARAPQPWWLAVVVLGTLALVARERRAPVPFLELSLLTSRQLGATYLRTTVTYTAFYCIFYGLPQWLEEARGLSTTTAGLVLLPITALGIATTVVSTYMEKRWGPRVPLLIGTAAMAAAGLMLCLPTSSSPLWVLVLICIVLGLPDGFNNMANQTSMYAAAPAGQSGAASGLYRTCQSLGANLAIALLSFLTSDSANDRALHHTGLLVASLSGLLLVAALVKRPDRSL
ncbi:MFS transporter [Streptomyces sp. CT34]|uniref:MFS transporter n=1 Tax=Streptomyces sp. CT34 TaxID=1553907 RepID=UPI00068D469A|nr:MFS transporter [Streptomyces sp. CT34]